jgi:DNA primase
VPVATLERRLGQLHRQERGRPAPALAPPTAAAAAPRTGDLDSIDRELVQIVLNEPTVVGRLVARVVAATLRDTPLRTILQACYDLHAEGLVPTFERVTLRLEDPRIRALAAGMLVPIADPGRFSEVVRPIAVGDRLELVLAQLAARDWQQRRRDLELALRRTDQATHPEEFRAFQRELQKHLTLRPDTKKKTAS